MISSTPSTAYVYVPQVIRRNDLSQQISLQFDNFEEVLTTLTKLLRGIDRKRIRGDQNPLRLLGRHELRGRRRQLRVEFFARTIRGIKLGA
ncbi:hypothetical protein [Candidatus Mycobacterium methanotrophicum]|uniref:hypothetical protein n=1 Tax=Candidatus Mycobacterium methanotrophicum TaxID=2943498 RepID=UPI001C5988E1|nr:hypothetical protein [Candidatus Mycobacterium methanotrophicum]